MSLPTHHEAAPAWQSIRVQLRRVIGDPAFEIWFAPLQVRDWDGETLHLQAPPGTKQWIAARYGRALERCVRETLGDRARVALDAGEARDASAANTRAVPAPTEAFNPRYSFEQFIIGQGNRLAHAAALAVAEHPGQAYNPLFLHAPPGLGKTHLLHAIGNYVQAFGGGATVRYTTAEAFTNHFLTALTTKALEPFKRAYRSADVLLIDDVQFLASKARTEEEFFHTFNALYENGRQLVLTCDRLPRSLLEVEVRLRERFESGLVADIAPPDHATRVAILRKRAALDRLQLGDVSVLDLIASRVTTNIRALEGALIRVVAYHSLTQRPVDLALATEVMDSIYPLPGFAEVTIGAVQAKVAGHYRLTVPELISASRTARVTWPRQVAIHLTRELTGASLQAIGEAFGGRNHATVLHACKRVAQRLATGDGMSTELDALSQQIRQPPADRDY